MNAKYCKKCIENKQSYGPDVFLGYYGSWMLIPDDNKCLFCGCSLEDSLLNTDELKTLEKISPDTSFLEAMIALKEKDPIEFQLKMSQFRTQVQQQEQVKQAKEESNKPKCPTCGSTNIEKISIGKKAFGGAMFGLLSSDVRKTMHCKDCGYKW